MSDTEQTNARSRPPKNRGEDLRRIMGGVEVFDSHRWLEDGETRARITTQLEYAASFLNKPEREGLRKRLAELAKIDTVSVLEDADYRFFSTRRAEEQRAVICPRRGRYADDEVLIDPCSIDPALTMSAAILTVTYHRSMLANGVRRGGE